MSNNNETKTKRDIVEHAIASEKNPNYMQYVMAILQVDAESQVKIVNAQCYKALRHDMEKRFGLATLDALTLDDEIE